MDPPLRPLTGLTDTQRAQAMRRLAVLRPHLEDDVALTVAARSAGVSHRTAQRWLAAYRDHGLAGLVVKARSDAGTRRLPDELFALIEGLALRRPAPSAANVHRQATVMAKRQGWPVPGYVTVWTIINDLDPGLVTLATQGSKAYDQTFELLHRHEAEAPNAMWQADHTRLDLVLVDGTRPWLTTVMDGYSRAVAGYSLSLSDPSALAAGSG